MSATNESAPKQQGAQEHVNEHAPADTPNDECIGTICYMVDDVHNDNDNDDDLEWIGTITYMHDE